MKIVLKKSQKKWEKSEIQSTKVQEQQREQGRRERAIRRDTHRVI